ncbi:interferon regulatory factor 9 isoform X2 [Amia ocellicauda]|uniref:interferon regulatory factor 9 isoform X2 n=1 Tax=Amia ocellicauda TaxID=2972642 RepID=UPI0034644383
MVGGVRSTRRLRSWLVEQVSSGRYPGLMWDDDAKTAFRIPWKHAGKQDFRTDQDAAIFKAWAEYKGKLRPGQRSDPASWKTRLRCALNKSPEFCEVSERSQLDISEPFKVYRLVPVSEQGITPPTAERGAKRRRVKNERRVEDEGQKQSRSVEPVAVEPIQMVEPVTTQLENIDQSAVVFKLEEHSPLNEIQLNFQIETSPPPRVLPSLVVSVFYVGQEVLRRESHGRDVRIAYYPPTSSSCCPPSPPQPNLSGTERISLPGPEVVRGSAEKRAAITALLGFLERGVMLASMGSGIRAQRFCQGRVYWTGSHAPDTAAAGGAASSPSPLLRKLERTNSPVTLFDRQTFREELELYQTQGGLPPQAEVTLCFGEEMTDSDNMAEKLITVQVYQPWAKQQLEELLAVRDSLSFFQELASESQLGEVTLNLISIS